MHVQTVEVFDNGTSLGLATVSNGTWSLTTAVGQGSHNTWSATATDEAGNTTSAGNTTLVQVDTTAPTVSFDTVSFSDTGVQGDHITKTDSVTLSGSVGDDVHVQTVEVFDNGTSLGLATVSNGTWSLTTAVGQGSHNTWSATATDEAGNTTSAGNTTLVQVDTTAPTVSFDTVSFSDTGVQGDHITKTDSVTLSGSVGDDVHVQTVEVFDNGTSLGLATVSNGTWSLTTAVGQGSHNTWSATATDEAGNTTSAGNTTLVQVDTTAPTVSFDTVSFSDTGVQGDHITKTDSVTLSGSVGDDVHVQTVEVFDNGTSLGLATVSNGTWSLTTAVGQGSHNTWSATATDEAGNTTSAGNTTLVQVDTTAPTVSFDTVSFSDTGVQGDHITKTDSVTLSGSVGDDVHVQTVEVFDNGTSLGLATVSNGTWSLTTAVGQGSHNTWSATATDEAGNTTSAGNTTLVQVDTTAPTVSFDTVSFSDTGVQGDHITKTDSVTLSGSVGDDVHVQTVEVFDNGTSLGLATVSNGTWSLTTAVGQGSHNTWSATATDEAGNTTSAGNTTLVQVDTTAPTVSFDTVSFSDTGVQGDHITKTDSVTLSGSVGDDVHVQTVEVFDNGTSLGLATVSNGTWSLTTAVGQGSHNTWSATATDEAGNTTSAGNTTLVQVDTTAPTVSFDTVSFSDTGVQGDHITKTDSVTLSGSVGDDVHVQTVEVFDNGTSLGLATVSNGTWSLTTAVGQGSHNTWSATATDEAGNTTSAGNTTLVQVDTTAPTVSFDTVSFSDTGVQGDHITKTDSVTLSGSVGDDVHVQTVEVFDNGTSLGLATVSNGTWSLTTAVGQGSHNTWSATATDEAGRARPDRRGVRQRHLARPCHGFQRHLESDHRGRPGQPQHLVGDGDG
ncbi:beta strand repeat-containing protein [Bradyrhizobium sp. JR3.5]